MNLRSGATFTRVDSKDSFHRVLGTSIGSSFFWGILRLLNFFSDPSEAVIAALNGDSGNIDMSVGDIYGGAYSGIGLTSKSIASSFGKLKDSTEEEIQNLNKDVRILKRGSILIICIIGYCKIPDYNGCCQYLDILKYACQVRRSSKSSMDWSSHRYPWIHANESGKLT